MGKQLNTSQRAMVAAKLANILNGSNQYEVKVGRSDDRPITNTDAAELLNVSEPTVRRARRVQRDAVPEVVEAVEKGELPVNTVLRISRFGFGPALAHFGNLGQVGSTDDEIAGGFLSGQSAGSDKIADLLGGDAQGLGRFDGGDKFRLHNRIV